MQLNRRYIKAVVIGLGINDTRPGSDERMVAKMEELREAIADL